MNTSTGKRRYGHPALTGVLPTPWLPLKKGQTLANYVDRDPNKGIDGNAVVLTLRRRYSAVRKRGQAVFANVAGKNSTAERQNGVDGSTEGDQAGNTETHRLSTASRQSPIAGTSAEALQPERTMSRRLSFDPATGVITLPDGEAFYERLANDSDSDYGEVSGETSSPGERSGNASPIDQETTEGQRAKRHSTYFHHPERRRHHVPGAFPM